LNGRLFLPEIHGGVLETRAPAIYLLFLGLDEATLKALARIAIRRRYDAGQMIFVEKDDAEALGEVIVRFYSIEGAKGTDSRIARVE